MAQYMTEQRKKLLDFFNCNPDKQFSARQIADILSEEKISQSAVYRNLVALEDSGMIRRSIKEGSREFLYQYIHLDVCKESIHMICLKCGATFHVSSVIAEQLSDLINEHDNFEIDKSKTVLYGLCTACR